MKYLKQILLSITLLIVAPAFSQTAQDWQNVLGLVPAKIEANKRRIEAAERERDKNEKAGFGRITDAERKEIEKRIAAEKEVEEKRIAAEKHKKFQEQRETYLLQIKKEGTRYLDSLRTYFVRIPIPGEFDPLYYKKGPEKNYEVMATEVTQSLWQEVMKENPSEFKGENLPVQRVSWLECITFCNKLSEKEGLNPCYSYNGKTDVSKWKWDYKKMEKWVDKDWDKLYKNLTCNFEVNGFRLPTYQELNYAAVAMCIYFEEKGNFFDDSCWYDENSRGKPHEVATKKANNFGIYDTSGNVCEWVWDTGSEPYYRCIHGGGYNMPKHKCRIGSTLDYDLKGRSSNIGLRLVRTVE